jgi:spermidine synthase
MMVNINSRLRSLYPIVKLYLATVPTYPGGFWSFTIGSKKYKDTNPDAFDKETKYVNKDILESCFALPNFVKERLEID